jgi:MraZ protein
MDFFERKLDDKNRLTIPSELRHEFEGGRVILTKGFAHYLHLYTEKVWNEEMEPALQGNILDEHIADLNVQFRSGKSVSSIDAKQGRITIEAHLLDHASIEKEVVAVRAGKYWRISAKQL